jgi:RecA-family ATPase
MKVEQRNVLYVTCEDDEAELWRQQAAICAAIGVPIQAVLGKLSLSGTRVILKHSHILAPQ